MKRIVFLCLAIMLAVFAGCNNQNNQSAEGGYVKINAEEAKKMMEDGEDFILLDVRTEAEFSERRIEGAMLIPDNEITEKAPQLLTDKGARILVYCRTGRRSALAANELIDMGYTSVYDFGGIVDWPYETIHD